jgi:DNA-binding response OmpR family regulator
MSEQRTILIAEDEALDLQFFELMLSKLGFNVEEASDGSEALNIIREKNIDLVIANTILPELSGWEILKTIKNDPNLASIPVILLSNIDNVKEKVESYESGAEDFVTKPFNFTVLLSRIRAALRKRELFMQIKLREDRIKLADKKGEELKGVLSAYTDTIHALNEEITSLLKKDFDAKSIAACLEKVSKELSTTEQDMKKQQEDIDIAFEEGFAMRRKEIGLNALEGK